MDQGPKSRQGGSTCPWWLLFTFDNPLRKWIHDPIKILKPYVEPGDTVLDIGCGMGYFTLGLAELAGAGGQVIAVDLQEQMLNGLRKRAIRAGLDDRIQLHQSSPDQVGLSEPVDFVLAFWMVHEVQQPEDFLRQIHELLKKGRKLMLVEPLIHVSGSAFERTLSLAKKIGFWVEEEPQVRASRAVVLSR